MELESFINSITSLSINQLSNNLQRIEKVFNDD